MRTATKNRMATIVVLALITWAFGCDLVRSGWHYAQAHPIQAAGWALGGVVILIVFLSVLALRLHD